MKNSEVAKILREIGEYLAMEGVAFKPRAYENAADAILELKEDILDVYKSGGLKALEEIPGVGVSIAEKIEEFIKTGRIKYYEAFKKKTPIDLESLEKVGGLGPKTIKVLYDFLGVRNIADLERVLKEKKLRNLPGFGQKSEEKILKNLEFVKLESGRRPLGEIEPIAEAFKAELKKLSDISRIEIAGSYRRRKETVGDLDILAISKKPEKVMDWFISRPDVLSVVVKGGTKSTVKLKDGLDVDLRVVSPESYGAALAYFTGSKEHNVVMREIAKEKGLKLNEYGLWRGERMIAGETEEGIYKALGMDYAAPEMRENLGEIELARKHKLPKLIGYKDLLGDLQVQTNYSDGANSISEIAEEAMRLGLKYIAITDHTVRLAMIHGLDDKKILKQMAEIDELNIKFGGKIRILKGTECDILKDGSLDLPDSILSKLEVVGVSIHSYFDLPKKIQTERLKKAMTNKNVDIIFHPTCRVLGKREACELDMDEIIETAKRTGTVLEIDAYPDRLDLKDEYIRKCVQAGVRMSIDSDSHSIRHLDYLKYGIAQARRGWATKNDIINVWPVEKMLKMLK